MKLKTILIILEQVVNSILHLIKSSDKPRQETGENLRNPKEKQRIVEGVRRFFDENYELRYNVMKQSEEYRSRHSMEVPGKSTEVPGGCTEVPDDCQELPWSRKKPLYGCHENAAWQQLTDRQLRRMAIEQMEQVGVAWSIDVELYVRSALVPLYNPVKEFLDHCGQWDGQTDHIRLMARRVPTDYDCWPDHFHRWMLAVVAQWMNLSRDYGNSVVPMLIGAQGTHKSTFCRLLLPPELREYYIDDIKLDAAEQVERMLCRMLLVNIDEYNAKTDREQAKIKRILTEKDVQTRRMRSDQYELRPRMASFIATTNDREPLCDATGSRRYLCCEVTGMIDTETPVDYRQMYAQAIYELSHGEPYHFSKDEEAAIEQHNLTYLCESTAEAVLLSYFKPGEPRKENFMRAVDIQKELRTHLKQNDVPTIRALTTALKRLHFRYGAIRGVRGWYVKRTEEL